MLRFFVAAAAVAVLATVAESRPDDGYGAPEASYAAPAESYGAPAESYGAPEASYTAPSYGAPVATGGLDLTLIIIPILALIGLFLLFPTYVTLTSVRRKRDAEDSTDLATDLVNRIQDMYQAVVESEECMERVACQVGALARDAGLSSSLAASTMMLAPAKYTKYAKKFALPTNCEKIKCGNMF